MPRVIAFLLISTILSFADHLIVSGGPSLNRWEKYRPQEDQHDRWWANFIRGATLRIDEIHRVYGKEKNIVWLVYRPSYDSRGREDGKNYISMIQQQATKRNVSLVWINSSGEMIRAINGRPGRSIETFDYFGHSNKHCFCLDYGSEIMAVSTQWLHENDIGRLRSSVFAENAYCKSWGCHTGQSMSLVWKQKLGIALEGTRGKTDYRALAEGKFPVGHGGWVR
jgi:hypothetical protein